MEGLADMGSGIPTWLQLIVAFGGIGAFIDFLVGRRGQDQTRDFLATWWIRFDDVRWNNFGREEALFSIATLSRLCGERLLSYRRWIFVVCSSLVFYLIAVMSESYECLTTIYRYGIHDYGCVWFPSLQNIGAIIISMVGLGISLSIVYKTSSLVAHRCDSGRWKNLVIFSVFLLAMYALAIAWSPVLQNLTASLESLSLALINRDISLSALAKEIAGSFRWVGLDLIGRLLSFDVMTTVIRTYNPFDIFGNGETPYIMQAQVLTGTEVHLVANQLVTTHFLEGDYIQRCLAMLASVMRLVIASLFFGACLFKPLLIGPLSLFWRRCIESDKPVFTLIFGGIAGFVSVVYRVLKSL